MNGRRMMVLGLLGSVALVGCSKKKPEAPTPQPAVQTDDDAARRAAEERARQEEAARQAAEARAREAAERARQALTETIHFKYDESTIVPEAQSKLMDKVSVLRTNPDVKLRIAGHADERGSVEYNLALGMRRAQAAKDFLVNYGLEATRFDVVTFGEERPIAQGHDEAAYAQNRRDEFTITAGGDSLTPATK